MTLKANALLSLKNVYICLLNFGGIQLAGVFHLSPVPGTDVLDAVFGQVPNGRHSAMEVFLVRLLQPGLDILQAAGGQRGVPRGHRRSG